MQDNQKNNPFELIPEVDTSKLVCSIGNKLCVIKENQDLQLDDVYVVHSRVYYGWNLKLIKGDGVNEVRVLNSELLDFFKVL